jgi:uncharacterized cofD-like protein
MTQMDETVYTSMSSVLPHIAGKRIATIGGGTGPFALLSRLKRLPCSVTAIVSMADSGGSSRRLMDEFGQLPLGDLRQALVALSRKGLLWRDVFAFRFGNGRRMSADHGGLSGHCLGNLIISALQELDEGDLLQAIADAEALLDVAGKVLPVTTSHATLHALLEDGSVIRGESEIDTRGASCPGPLASVTQVYLEPTVAPCAEAIEAIGRADVIVIGPGDLYTSVLPNLLVSDIAAAVRGATATKVYICNLMTKHGETDGFQASDFVREIHRYLGGRLDRVILHNGALPPSLREMYVAQGQCPVAPDTPTVRRMGVEVVVDDVLAIHPDHPDHLVRHDADRLIRAIFSRGDEAVAALAHTHALAARSS